MILCCSNVCRRRTKNFLVRIFHVESTDSRRGRRCLQDTYPAAMKPSPPARQVSKAKSAPETPERKGKGLCDVCEDQIGVGLGLRWNVSVVDCPIFTSIKSVPAMGAPMMGIRHGNVLVNFVLHFIMSLLQDMAR